jgi:hypothetical protein
MSQVSLRLVHSRPFLGAADDLAILLLLSLTGLIIELTIMSTGVVIPY